MKTSIIKPQTRKIQSAISSKKNSNVSSIIYKQIHAQMEHTYEKNKSSKIVKDDKKTAIQKFSLGNVKKKSSAINIPLQHPQLRQNIITNINKTIREFQLERKSFQYQYIIGKGGFGKVWRVQHLKNRNQYAMKQMLKSLVMTKKSVQSVMNERTLLADLNSPFLVNMHYAFQDRDTLYLVLDLMEGGDLRYHIGNKSFDEIQSKFFIGCIVLGLQYLHSHKIIHRDIKPENLVLDSKGYIRVTDLGIARVQKMTNCSDTSGTPGYMSPQVICRQNHSPVSDFFALGVIAYQLMTGKRPYQGRSRNQIRDQMLAKQVQLKPSDIPQNWSYQSADFINKLIQRKPQNRLGFKGVNQIKNHPWIKDINWQKLYNKQIQSPFIPSMKKNNFDQDDQITIEDQQEAQLIEKNSLLLRKLQFQQLFKNYYYDSNMIKSKLKITKNNFFNQNSVQKKQQQKISLKKNEDYIKKEKETIIKKSIETIDTAPKDNLRKYSGNYTNQKFFLRQYRC